ncbi:hypothetical protein ACQKFK_20220 [Bacillus mycoides]|uniref:hypothetical protein n=1 Tax=Bacillus mycoides TaxID=1405 RepID=UPI003D093277
MSKYIGTVLFKILVVLFSLLIQAVIQVASPTDGVEIEAPQTIVVSFLTVMLFYRGFEGEGDYQKGILI